MEWFERIERGNDLISLGTETANVKPLQCNGVSNYDKPARCQVTVRTDTQSMFSKNCKNPNKDMCYMHCDCSFCSTYYLETKNRGLRWNEAEQENSPNSKSFLEQIINATNIDKLKCILIAVAEDVCLSSYLPRAKEHYKNMENNKKIKTKIKSLEKEIEKLKEEIK
jgi:hypothetical protein|tara:strand:+ start:1003 stop:1503 length:501 start_codon:yes stop_codon:yes gene_type:complete